MTEPAVLQADYRIIKPVPSRSSYVLQLEVPWEAYDHVNRALGSPPKPGENRWVAIALLTPEAVAKNAPGMSLDAMHGRKQVTYHDHQLGEPKPKGPHSDYAQALYKSYFMRSEKVCEALGTDEEYRKWIQRQPSCLTGNFSEYVDGEGRCEAAHVRRAASSGTGYKPPYSCIPLDRGEHLLQHQKGELELLRAAGISVARLCEPQKIADAKDYFDKRAIEYREKWVHGRLCAVMGVESLTDTDPEKLRKWCESKGVEEALPK